MSSTFSSEFERITSKITSGENFTFARYADGERSILMNMPILNGTQAYDVDHWMYNNNTKFSAALAETCNHREKEYNHAISCACCDKHGELFYRNLFENHNITFANLFINANYKKFISFAENLKRPVNIIANKRALFSKYPFEVSHMYLVEDDCVNWFEADYELITDQMREMAENKQNELFFVAAGPLSEILIHKMFSANKNNTYVDVGSSLDIYTHGRKTRPYQNPDSQYHSKECTF